MKETTILDKRGIKVFVTCFPNKKRPCLAAQIDGCVYKIASFNDEIVARWFIEIMEEILCEGE